MARRGRSLAVVALVAAAVLPGCSAGYVARAAVEEARILWRRKPIEEVLARESLGAERRAKLEMVLAARRFAEKRLGLRVGGSYRSISTVDGSEVVQLLTAARRDRLESYTWWFPIVGRVPYKGFFSKKQALAATKSLEGRGYDTYIRPAIAFSTLGWFDDPLLSSLLERSRVTLADVVFHELFHNTVFVAGEMDFNESAANFAGHRAAIEFFCAGPRPAPDECRAARADWRDTLTISSFLARALADLEKFYSSSPGPGALEEGRARIFDEIHGGLSRLELAAGRYANPGSAALNNAFLLHQRTYLRDLDLFEELYRGRGSLARAIAEIEIAVKKGGDPFDRVRGLLGGAADPRVAGGGGKRGQAPDSSAQQP